MPSGREASRIYMSRRYRERRSYALMALGERCCRCGSKNDLQVDHVDPSKKTMNFARMTHVGMRRFLAELAECQLLCASCHSKKTVEEDLGRELRKHGTLAMYKRGHCRCEPCRAANAEESRKYKAQRRRAAALGGET